MTNYGNVLPMTGKRLAAIMTALFNTMVSSLCRIFLKVNLFWENFLFVKFHFSIKHFKKFLRFMYEMPSKFKNTDCWRIRITHFCS